MQAVSLIQSRFAIILLSIFIVLQLFLIFGNRYTVLPHWASSGSSAPTPASSTWNFNTTRDAHNHALTYDQCTAAFPKLDYGIERSVAYWKARNHQINENDVNISWTGKGGIRALIYENELRIVKTQDPHHFKDHHDARRVIFVLSQIHRALLGAIAIGENVPNIEFAIAVNDYAKLPDDKEDTHAVWTFDRKLGSRKDERIWLMPDFNFWAWNPVADAYNDARRRAISHDAAVEDKIQKI